MIKIDQKTTYSEAEYKIHALSKEDALTAYFIHGENKKINIADYYNQILGKNLDYPRLPLVQVGSSKSKRMKLFPMEFCLLKGDQKAKQINERQIADLIRFSCKTCE